MTLRELYESIGGDYDQALRVLRMEKLMDKHIRKYIKNGAVEDLLSAGEDMDPVRLFETSHAVKGVSANLGLVRLAEAASEISEEFRPGNPRRLTDEQVKEKMSRIRELYALTEETIKKYEEG